MQSIIDDLLAGAITAIANKMEIRENQNNADSKILGIYESYLSQFGPMAYQIGTRSTLAVYYNKSASGKGERKYILELIFSLLQSHNGLGFANGQDFDQWIYSILRNTQISQTDEDLLIDASIALKRAIRTFYLTEK